MSNQALLKVENLKTWFSGDTTTVRAVDGVSFDIHKGETFALLGESGCGKSMTALSVMRLVPEPAGKIVDGIIKLGGDNLLSYPEQGMRNIRGNKIAMIFQEPMTSLNPVLTVGYQIIEVLARHKGMKGAQATTRAIELLTQVGIPEAAQRITEYPHQLSGGMKQRVMIAMALAGEPDLLIADEPTTALDVTIQAQILDLLKDIQQKTGMAILLITHDLGVVAEMADHVGVMYAGQLVELASREQFFKEPKHPYARKLFESLPGMGKRGQSLAVMRGSVPSLSREFVGCRFEPRCDYAWQRCPNNIPQWQLLEGGHGVSCHLYNEQWGKESTGIPQLSETMDNTGNGQSPSGDPLLKVEQLKVHFPIRKGLMKKQVGAVYAVDGVDIEVKPGQTVALVGESGCGKTTVGKSILQLIETTAGKVSFAGVDLTTLDKKSLRARRRDFQFIFQDPFSSMNPRMRVSDVIEEGMIAQRVGGNAKQRQARIDQLLEQVGLSAEMKQRYPHEFSGGQRQRICIARALAVEPKLIICDEPTSALDVSVQAQILNLLKKLQNEMGLAFLFITHNLSVVEYLAHEVAVMYLGRIVEKGSVQEVVNNPAHPYSKMLLAAMPTIELEGKEQVIRIEGELPSPINPPQGCHFHPRCPEATSECSQQYPDNRSLSDTHQVRCVLYPLN